MKSSSGQYYVALDHIRAVAALMVFTWHFVHGGNGQLAGPPAFPLSLLSEGHTGVALFMTLSGYLFAKLLDGRRIHYGAFIWNRFLRLVPLLLLVVVIVGIRKWNAGEDLHAYAVNVAKGLVLPTLPNGGWSITTEFHFYLVLPLLLLLSRRHRYALLLVLPFTILLRYALYLSYGAVDQLAYLTIVGRIDQFVLGIVGYQLRGLITGRHLLAAAGFLLFAGAYWQFDSLGGYYNSPPSAGRDVIWVYLPTIEGLGYASLIAWYDTSFTHSTGRLSRFLALVGTYSYSIYLLHHFFVFRMARHVNKNWVDLSDLHVALLLAPVAFLLMIPLGYLSYRFVESPFLKFRTRYVRDDSPASGDAERRGAAAGGEGGHRR
jgi:peptidoglycan/LPS O-acetylase OafA/YrhL